MNFSRMNDYNSYYAELHEAEDRHEKQVNDIVNEYECSEETAKIMIDNNLSIEEAENE